MNNHNKVVAVLVGSVFSAIIVALSINHWVYSGKESTIDRLPGASASTKPVHFEPKSKAPTRAVQPSGGDTLTVQHPKIKDSRSGIGTVYMDDRLGRCIVTAERFVPTSHGQFKRTQTIKTELKYPYIRMEDSIAVDPVTGVVTTLQHQEMAADHVLVTLNADNSDAIMQDLSRQFGSMVIKKCMAPNTYLVSADFEDLDGISKQIAIFTQGSKIVKYAEPDYLSHPSSVPNDPQFSQLWGMNNTGQLGGVKDADIDAPEAWNICTGDRVVKVGVIDTGVDYNHSDLAANAWTNPREVAGNGKDDDGDGFIDDVRGWNFYSDNSNCIDDNGHGTHVAGTIGAAGGNGLGVAGVCWKVTIVPIKFMNSGGSGFTSDAVDSVYYATKIGVQLTSNSWGSTGFSQALKDAIANAGSKGILFVAAAGNSGVNDDVTPFYPAAFDCPNIISVAATDMYDKLASFSCYGAKSVDIAAPGVNIYSCYLKNSYVLMSGTSMATPHVAGACALLKAYAPDLTADLIKSYIIKSADVISSMQGKCVSNGRLNIFNALTLLNKTQPELVYGVISGGSFHTIALKKNGTVWAWGDNGYGALGNGTTVASNIPIPVAGLSNIVQVVGGYRHSAALRSNGTVMSWGYNYGGNVGDGTTIPRQTPVMVVGLSNVVRVCSTDLSTLALKSDGTVWAWGANNYGQLGDGTTVNRYSPVKVSNLTGVVAIATGIYHSMALKSDGTVWAWGYNGNGELGDGTTINKITPVRVSNITGIMDISACCNTSLALKSDGTVWGWGDNSYGQLGNGSSYLFCHSVVPGMVSDLKNVVQISAGSATSMALKSDGTVWVWGFNNYYAIGAGFSKYCWVKPVQVPQISSVISISAGGNHYLALKSDGTLWSWGSNYFGQMGDGSNTGSLTPVQVKGFTF